VQITEDRKKRVIDLHFNQHKSYAKIAQIEHISPRDIHAIIKEEETRRQKYRHQQQQQEIFSKAYKLFSEGKTPVEVAIILNLPASKVSKLYREYWDLRGLQQLNIIYKETNGKLGPFLKLYKELIKKRRMSIEQVVNAVDIAINKLPHMETLYIQAKDQAEKMQHTVQRLANDIEARKHKISILDKTAFSIEMDCKRKQQEIRELITQKDRIEKLIANILHEEGYSKLKQIVKENVKAVLSEKRVLISISFAAVIQTLKADPQMVKLIQNMPSANGGEQYNDNNNITQYFESNKDRILNLAEKNYENLIEALTDNVTNTVGVSSSNSTLSVPQSSSTFPNLPNQTHTYRKDDSEIYHNSKGDIAD
jgi:DNA-binding CsgD family transcriptional regulator